MSSATGWPILKHDERGGAGRMCRGEKRRRRECARPRDQSCAGASESVEHRSDAVGPLLQGWHRARLHRIGRSTARLVEKNEPTERCHRLNPPLDGWQLRKVLAASEPIRDEHYVSLTLSGSAIRDAQVPVQRIARLREHCRSVKRSGGRVVSVYAVESIPLKCSSASRCRDLLKTFWSGRLARQANARRHNQGTSPSGKSEPRDCSGQQHPDRRRKSY